MSEAPPLLLNMGAELVSAGGMNPMPAPATATGTQGNEFAGVLQSVLNPSPAQENSNPLPGTPQAGNPLLFMQAGGLVNPLLAQVDMPLEAMLTGKSLPTGEPELAWQALLAEGESLESSVPPVELTSGELVASGLEELTAEKFIQAQPAQYGGEPGKQEPGAIDSSARATNILSAHTAINNDNKPVSALAMAMVGVHGQDAAAIVKPAISSTEQDVLSKMGRAQQDMSKSINPVQPDASSVVDELPVSGYQPFKEMPQQPVANGKQDGLETVSNKLESIMANTTEQVVVAKPVSQSGISNYAAISAVSSSLPSISAATPTIAQMTIGPENPAWGDTLGNRVQWMAGQNIQEARVRLHPQELGMLDVRIQIGSDQQTTISFSSPHAQVRDALESAIPRLREMFGENGLSLGDVNVSQHSSSQQGHADPDNKSANSTQSNHTFASNEITDVASVPSIMARGNGMLDLYA